MKTILFCSEASYLSTGYANYGLEVLDRLHSTGKYNLVEYGIYGDNKDPRSKLPWKFEGSLPTNEQEVKEYESNRLNQFGKYKFEQVCLKHKPDIVFDIRDNWMCNYQVFSPFRRLYNLIWMPTVDSSPQPDEWVWEFEQCDGIFTYTKWGETELRKRSSRINYLGQASPAANYDIYKPANKAQIKKQLGFEDNAFIIGTTMRNQKRKLFPSLISAFDKLCDSGQIENPILYMHTTWPDMGWNLPYLIKNSKHAHRIYMTYQCKCGTVFPNRFSDAITICKKCGNFSACTPNTYNGISRETLVGIYNLFDIYVQPITQEGFGIPVVEAAACEVPVFGTNYSSLESVIPDCGGQLIECDLHMEVDKQTYVAAVKEEDLVTKILNYYKKDEIEKERKRKNARKKTMENYSYDKTVQNLMSVFDQLPQKDWSVPPILMQPNPQPPQMNVYDFVGWAITNILGKPEWVGTHYHTKHVRYLIQQNKFDGFGGPLMNEMSALGIQMRNQPYNHNNLLNEFANMRHSWNQWEQIRTQ